MSEPKRSTTIPIAYVSLRLPPMTSSGSYRAEAVLRYLPERGFSIRAVTLPSEATFGNELLGDGGDRQATAVTVLRPTSPYDAAVLRLSEIPWVRWLQRELLNPDVGLLWAHHVARTTAPLLEDVRLVYATAPPYSGLVAGRLLARRLGVPFVAEVRDPPSFDRGVQPRSAFTKWRRRRFESKHLGAADHVITVTPRTRELLLEIHSHLDPLKVHVVTNGYPEMEIDTTLAKRDPTRFTVTYVGSYQGDTDLTRDSWFTPTILIPPLERLGIPADLRVVGPVRASQRRHLATDSTTLRITVTGQVDRSIALAELAAADAALILADDHPWWIGRKVFEALAYSQRILAVVPTGDTTDLLMDSEKTWISQPGDTDELGACVEEIYRQWREGIIPSQGPPAGLQTDRSCVGEIASVLEAALGEA